MAKQKIGITISARDKTRQAFSKVSKAMNVLRKSVFNLKTGIGALVGVGGFLALARAGLKSIDNIGKMSRTLGLTTEQLGTLQHMANLGGTSLDTFARSVRNLNKGALDFVTKGTGEAKDAFEALGITVDEVSANSDDQIRLMGLVADRLATLRPGVEKTALAMKLFGSRSIEILPALEGGSKAIEGMRKEAEQLGLIMGKDAVGEVEKANDAMARLMSIFTAIRNKVVIALAPALERVATVLKETLVHSLDLSGKGIEDFTKKTLKRFMELLVTSVEVVEDIIRGLVKGINVFRRISNSTEILFHGFDKAKQGLRAFSDLLTPLPEKEFEVAESTGHLAQAIEVVEEKTKKTTSALENFRKQAEDTRGTLEQTAVSGLNKLEDALVNVGDKTKSLKDSFKEMALSIVQDMQRMMIKKTITGPLSKLLGGGIGNIFSGFSGGGSGGFSGAPVGATPFANGGSIRAGQLGLVGEKGPELFVPRTSGKIISNKDVSGGGVTVNNTFDFTNANQATVSMLQQESERIKQETFNNVFNAISRGGRASRIVGRRA